MLSEVSILLISGVKRLGDSVVAEMDSTWSVAPTSTRVAAYMAALAGTLVLLKLQAPKDPVSMVRWDGHSDRLNCQPTNKIGEHG